MSTSKTPNQDSGSFMMLFSLMLLLFIMFDKNLRNALGLFVNFLFYPIIGFGGNYPIVSLLLAGTIMSLLSIVLRHKNTDWVAMAKSQKIMKALGQESKEARMQGDHFRMEKLMVEQRKRGQEQMLQSSMQMKSTMSSMVFIIAIFTWIALFIGNLDNRTVSIPWASNVYLTRGGPFFKVAPVWIFVYSLVTIPLGQVVQKVLKEVTYKNRISLMELEEMRGEGTVAEGVTEEEEQNLSEDIDEEEENTEEEEEEEEENTEEEEEEDSLSEEDVIHTLRDSTKFVVPSFVEAESFAYIFITLKNKSEHTLDEITLDTSDMESYFDVQGSVGVVAFKPGMEVEEKIRIKAKYSKGTFPVKLKLCSHGVDLEKDYTIKVGGTEVY